MDQTRRLVLFFVLTGLVWGAWFGFIQPKFFPLPKNPPAAVDSEEPEADDLAPTDAAVDAKEGEPEAPKPQLDKPENPRQTVTLGALDPKTGYLQQVTLDSRGAAVASIALNDPRYRDLTRRDKPLNVVGATGEPAFTTFQTAVASIDAQLAEFKTDTTRVDWKAEPIADPDAPGVNKGVAFTLTAPDGSVELVKTYTLRRSKAGVDALARDTDPQGYLVDVALTFRNLTDERQTLTYTLQGPEGLPLENEEHTSKYRELELGFLDEDGDLSHASMTAGDATEEAAKAAAAAKATKTAAAADRRLQSLRKQVDDLATQTKGKPGDAALKKQLAEVQADLAAAQVKAQEATDAAQEASRGLERWQKPFRYLGVEVQYFTSLLFPQDKRPLAERFKKPWIAAGEPQLVAEGAKAEFNDVSFTLTSAPIVLSPNGEVTQFWSLYAGPKRQELLEPLGADAVLDYGWFGVISRGMLWLLETLHSVGAPYWLAIIGLTVIVRAMLFPISRKQAILAAKMKELQPKLTELKAKFGDDQEKFLKAQMELFRKHGYGPFGPMVSASGCLPIFLQLPIFIGLYNALQNSVDLRMAEFLWIDNLAAPDALFRLPFALPFLGQDFNLLPLITVVLFYIQQKLFMPPATSPEQEAQYKMMNFMMIFMGVFFYHVPAGLCVYFIASSLWSIAERKLLARTREAHVSAAESAEIDHEIEEMTHTRKPGGKGPKGKPGKTQPAAPTAPKQPTWLERLFEAAEQARKQAELGDDKTKPNGAKPKSRTKRF